MQLLQIVMNAIWTRIKLLKIANNVKMGIFYHKINWFVPKIVLLSNLIHIMMIVHNNAKAAMKHAKHAMAQIVMIACHVLYQNYYQMAANA